MPSAKDKRMLYGGQYRLSQELADVIKKYASSGHAKYVHNMTAYVEMNHFDVDRMLIGENINKPKLMEIHRQSAKGNHTLWNTKREAILLDGIVKLGRKYKVQLEKPLRIDSRGDIMIKVKQSPKFYKEMGSNW
jgi:hypothetical protein